MIRSLYPFALQRRAGLAGNLASPRISVVVYLSRMAEKETTLKELGEMLTHVVKHMATKDDLKEFREETAENFRALRAEVADVRRDVEELKSRADNSAGYSKEIDHALARIAAIEKHLGIEKKIAA
jgi:chaperonin cofactor prefoldin